MFLASNVAFSDANLTATIFFDKFLTAQNLGGRAIAPSTPATAPLRLSVPIFYRSAGPAAPGGYMSRKRRLSTTRNLWPIYTYATQLDSTVESSLRRVGVNLPLAAGAGIDDCLRAVA